MANLNKVMLIGNLTRDPEIKYLPKGTAIAQLGLAVNRTWSNDSGEKQEETTFVDVEFYGRTAEIAGEYLKKGRSVYIEGRLKLDSWDDKASGQKRYKMKVVGEQMQMLGGRESGEGGSGGSSGGSSGGNYGGGSGGSGGGERQYNENRPAARPQSRPATPPPRPPVDPDLDAGEDDIPF